MLSARSRSPAELNEQFSDPIFSEPYIEVDEQRQDPEPHRYVHGGFKGTRARFSFYFPPVDQYQGRFFHNTYPLAVTSDIGPFPVDFEVGTGDLGFTFASGAYYVQTNNGGVFRDGDGDPAIPAYRVNAAAAKFSRLVAADVYGGSRGEHRPYGYLFGGSGGAFQTMGAAENTCGIWDGFLPYVPGCNHAIPSLSTVRMHALRVLRRRNRLAAIVDAMEPGGSGDPYAGLDEEEAAALREASLMGFPPRGWYSHETMDSGYFASIVGMIPALDPAYADDYWSRPGYLGSDPGSTVRAERFAFDSAIASITARPPWVIELSGDPGRPCGNAHLVVLSGKAKGAMLPIAKNRAGTVHLAGTADPRAAGALGAGDAVRIDNSWALALETYHRHQLPPTGDYCGWDQFRDVSGKPLHPQRSVLVGPAGTISAAGSVLEGSIHGKMLMLAALLDIDAFPWQADWYRSKVKAALGSHYAESFALCFVDNAQHENPQSPLARAHAVSYGGALQQGLRDLAAWVERGERPAESVYEIVDSQVIVPAGAAQRGGIQPVISLLANGGERAEVAVGEPVRFTATIDVPPGTGKIVSAQWDFGGAGNFPLAHSLGPPESSVTIAAQHAYRDRGTHFAVLRVASQREGDRHTRYGRVQNIARVRVVVT